MTLRAARSRGEMDILARRYLRRRPHPIRELLHCEILSGGDQQRVDAQILEDMNCEMWWFFEGPQGEIE